MAYVRVYHPETNEPFDVPEHKADELRLQHGWNTQPFEIVGTQKVDEALVQEVQEVTSRASRRPFRSSTTESED